MGGFLGPLGQGRFALHLPPQLTGTDYQGGGWFILVFAPNDDFLGNS